MQERGDSPTRIQQSKHHHASLLSKPQSQVPPLLKVTAITLLVIPNRRDLFFFLQKAPPSPVFNKHRRGVLELQTRGTCPLNKTKKQEQAAAGSACVASRGAWLHLGGVTMMLMLRLSDTDGEVNNGHV